MVNKFCDDWEQDIFSCQTECTLHCCPNQAWFQQARIASNLLKSLVSTIGFCCSKDFVSLCSRGTMLADFEAKITKEILTKELFFCGRGPLNSNVTRHNLSFFSLVSFLSPQGHCSLPCFLCQELFYSSFFTKPFPRVCICQKLILLQKTEA